MEFIRHVALIWLVIGVARPAVPHRAAVLHPGRRRRGLVWVTKILTDPFHDIKLYYKAPLYLLRGELIDPRHAQQHGDDEDLTSDERACERAA